MFGPDGWDARVRIGALVPAADVGPESELRAMAPAQVGIHAARVPFGAMAAGGGMDPTIPLAPVIGFAQPPGIDDAAALLAQAPIGAIGVGFFSHAYALGPEQEAAMVRRLGEVARGIPVVSPGLAARDALAALGVRRIMLVSPPWFDAALGELGRAYFTDAGVDVVHAASAELASDQFAITRLGLRDWVVRATPDDAEAVVIGGNGFRAVGAIAAIEQSLGRPVVTANQVLLWALLRAAGANPAIVTGHGRLFAVGEVSPAGAARP